MSQFSHLTSKMNLSTRSSMLALFGLSQEDRDLSLSRKPKSSIRIEIMACIGQTGDPVLGAAGRSARTDARVTVDCEGDCIVGLQKDCSTLGVLTARSDHALERWGETLSA